jgi:hypothetical protein
MVGAVPPLTLQLFGIEDYQSFFHARAFGVLNEKA